MEPPLGSFNAKRKGGKEPSQGTTFLACSQAATNFCPPSVPIGLVVVFSIYSTCACPGFRVAGSSLLPAPACSACFYSPPRYACAHPSPFQAPFYPTCITHVRLLICRLLPSLLVCCTALCLYMGEPTASLSLPTSFHSSKPSFFMHPQGCTVSTPCWLGDRGGGPPGNAG